jgi:hypothetical protein
MWLHHRFLTAIFADKCEYYTVSLSGCVAMMRRFALRFPLFLSLMLALPATVQKEGVAFSSINAGNFVQLQPVATIRFEEFDTGRFMMSDNGRLFAAENRQGWVVIWNDGGTVL